MSQRLPDTATPTPSSSTPPNTENLALVCAALGALGVGLALVWVGSSARDAGVAWPALGALAQSAALLSAMGLWWRRQAARARRADARANALDERVRLLESVVANAPAALILSDVRGRISFANSYASELLGGGAALAGQDFQDVLDRFPPELREAIGSPRFVVVDSGQEPESYHVSSRDLDHGHQFFKLHMLRRVTDEVNRQEVEVWKKVIRVFSHELNNSLAPIASLVHSARQLVRRTDSADKLERVLDTVRERTLHLGAFLDSYARFARLPRPEKSDVPWRAFLERLQSLSRFTITEPLPEDPGRFDEAQLEQVLLNLVKNAHEAVPDASLAAVAIAVQPTARGVAVRVEDRGPGMSEDALRQAHLPFYSTKRTGTGLGLALCRDIVVAHGGQLQLRNREGGGLVVTCWLPSRDHPDEDLAER